MSVQPLEESVSFISQQVAARLASWRSSFELSPLFHAQQVAHARVTVTKPQYFIPNRRAPTLSGREGNRRRTGHSLNNAQSYRHWRPVFRHAAEDSTRVRTVDSQQTCFSDGRLTVTRAQRNGVFQSIVDCGGVPRPSQQGCSSVLERVGQLAIGGDDRGRSSIFAFVSTDFRCGATI